MATEAVTEASSAPVERPSIFHGPSEPRLVAQTLANFLDLQCRQFAGRECLVIPWTGTRWTYGDLATQSTCLARYLFDCGVQPGDRVGILAGNRAEYAAAFFACMRVDAILVILNNTYTPSEAEYALGYTGKPYS